MTNVNVYKVIFYIFAPALTASKILTFGIADLEKVGQCDTAYYFRNGTNQWQISGAKKGA